MFFILRLLIDMVARENGRSTCSRTMLEKCGSEKGVNIGEREDK